MYVAVTRAGDLLHLTMARKRTMVGRAWSSGGFSQSFTIPSRFLKEITPGLLTGYYPTGEERSSSGGRGEAGFEYGNRTGNMENGRSGGYSENIAARASGQKLWRDGWRQQIWLQLERHGRLGIIRQRLFRRKWQRRQPQQRGWLQRPPGIQRI